MSLPASARELAKANPEELAAVLATGQIFIAQGGTGQLSGIYRAMASELMAYGDFTGMKKAELTSLGELVVDWRYDVLERLDAAKGEISEAERMKAQGAQDGLDETITFAPVKEIKQAAQAADELRPAYTRLDTQLGSVSQKLGGFSSALTLNPSASGAYRKQTEKLLEGLLQSSGTGFDALWRSLPKGSQERKVLELLGQLLRTQAKAADLSVPAQPGVLWLPGVEELSKALEAAVAKLPPDSPIHGIVKAGKETGQAIVDFNTACNPANTAFVPRVPSLAEAYEQLKDLVKDHPEATFVVVHAGFEKGVNQGYYIQKLGPEAYAQLAIDARDTESEIMLVQKGQQRSGSALRVIESAHELEGDGSKLFKEHSIEETAFGGSAEKRASTVAAEVLLSMVVTRYDQTRKHYGQLQTVSPAAIDILAAAAAGKTTAQAIAALNGIFALPRAKGLSGAAEELVDDVLDKGGYGKELLDHGFAGLDVGAFTDFLKDYSQALTKMSPEEALKATLALPRYSTNTSTGEALARFFMTSCLAADRMVSLQDQEIAQAKDLLAGKSGNVGLETIPFAMIRSNPALLPKLAKVLDFRYLPEGKDFPPYKNEAEIRKVYQDSAKTAHPMSDGEAAFYAMCLHGVTGEYIEMGATMAAMIGATITLQGALAAGLAAAGAGTMGAALGSGILTAGLMGVYSVKQTYDQADDTAAGVGAGFRNMADYDASLRAIDVSIDSAIYNLLTAPAMVFIGAAGAASTSISPLGKATIALGADIGQYVFDPDTIETYKQGRWKDLAIGFAMSTVFNMGDMYQGAKAGMETRPKIMEGSVQAAVVGKELHVRIEGEWQVATKVPGTENSYTVEIGGKKASFDLSQAAIGKNKTVTRPEILFAKPKADAEPGSASVVKRGSSQTPSQTPRAAGPAGSVTAGQLKADYAPLGAPALAAFDTGAGGAPLRPGIRDLIQAGATQPRGEGLRPLLTLDQAGRIGEALAAYPAEASWLHDTLLKGQSPEAQIVLLKAFAAQHIALGSTDPKVPELARKQLAQFAADIRGLDVATLIQKTTPWATQENWGTAGLEHKGGRVQDGEMNCVGAGAYVLMDDYNPMTAFYAAQAGSGQQGGDTRAAALLAEAGDVTSPRELSKPEKQAEKAYGVIAEGVGKQTGRTPREKLSLELVEWAHGQRGARKFDKLDQATILTHALEALPPGQRAQFTTDLGLALAGDEAKLPDFARKLYDQLPQDADGSYMRQALATVFGIKEQNGIATGGSTPYKTGIGELNALLSPAYKALAGDPVLKKALAGEGVKSFREFCEVVTLSSRDAKGQPQAQGADITPLSDLLAKKLGIGFDVIKPGPGTIDAAMIGRMADAVEAFGAVPMAIVQNVKGGGEHQLMLVGVARDQATGTISFSVQDTATGLMTSGITAEMLQKGDIFAHVPRGLRERLGVSLGLSDPELKCYLEKGEMPVTPVVEIAIPHRLPAGQAAPPLPIVPGAPAAGRGMAGPSPQALQAMPSITLLTASGENISLPLRPDEITSSGNPHFKDANGLEQPDDWVPKIGEIIIHKNMRWEILAVEPDILIKPRPEVSTGAVAGSTKAKLQADGRMIHNPEVLSQKIDARLEYLYQNDRKFYDAIETLAAAASSDTERVFIYRAIGAGFNPKKQSGGYDLKAITEFALTIHDMPPDQIVRDYTMTTARQYFKNSCVPASFQVAKAQSDPIYASILKTNPEAVVREQAWYLEQSGGKAIVMDSPAWTPELRELFKDLPADAAFKPNEGSTPEQPMWARILSDHYGVDYAVMSSKIQAGKLEAAGIPTKGLQTFAGGKEALAIMAQAAASGFPVPFGMHGHHYVLLPYGVVETGVKRLFIVHEPTSGETFTLDLDNPTQPGTFNPMAQPADITNFHVPKEFLPAFDDTGSAPAIVPSAKKPEDTLPSTPVVKKPDDTLPSIPAVKPPTDSGQTLPLQDAVQAP
ncbi:MAG: hypothetical protein ACAI44_32335 [Candidatus Sericytochromatia bacterium]